MKSKKQQNPKTPKPHQTNLFYVDRIYEKVAKHTKIEAERKYISIEAVDQSPVFLMLMDFISPPLLKTPPPDICYGFSFTVISLLFIGAADIADTPANPPDFIFNFSLSMV